MKDSQKVYIRGNQDRGSEVIKMLEDRGGCNHCRFDGEDPDSIYFISHEGSIRCKFSECEFGKVIIDNYRELKLPEKWKDGDVLIANNGTCYKVFWEYDSDIAFYAYNMSMQIDGTLTKYTGSIWHGEKIKCFRKDFRLAAPSEVERFHELLHKHGADWDAEKGQLVEWRWKPENGEGYYYIFSRGTVGLCAWLDDGIDNSRFSIGNCFKTKKEAETMAEKIKKLLKGE